ncbi:hypothetical protein TWF281_011959 [Arthrobotrys megalospora]
MKRIREAESKTESKKPESESKAVEYRLEFETNERSGNLEKNVGGKQMRGKRCGWIKKSEAGTEQLVLEPVLTRGLLSGQEKNKLSSHFLSIRVYLRPSSI